MRGARVMRFSRAVLVSVPVSASTSVCVTDAVPVLVSVIETDVRVREAIPDEVSEPESEVVELDRSVVVVALSAVLSVSSALSGTVVVSDIVTDTGGAVVTTIPSGGCSAPSASSGLKMVIGPLQVDASWLSWQNTGSKMRTSLVSARGDVR